MKKVREEKVCITESGKECLASIDFSDTFATTNHVDSIERVTELIFETMPKWIDKLFEFRNWMVSFWGLKTDFKSKDGVGFFKTYKESKNEIILGVDDSHLNFRALVCNTGTKCYNIKVTTLVHYNNRKGKIYMRLIKPFHVWVGKTGF